MSSRTSPLPYSELVRDAKREILSRALEMCFGNVTLAAGLLGLQRTYLHRLIRELHVARPGRAGGAQ